MWAGLSVGTLHNAREDCLPRILSKAGYYLGQSFVMTCSDFLVSHQRKCDCAWLAWQHGGFIVAERWWNHYTWIQGINHCRVYNCYNYQAHGHDRSGILPRLEWYLMVLVLVFGLVWIIGLSLLVNSFVLCGATTLVLCGTITLVLSRATTLVLCGTHHPLWLSFSLIGWFSMWLGIGLSSGDIFGLWQDHEEIIWVEWFTCSIPPLTN
jgi:hypothetical protein